MRCLRNSSIFTCFIMLFSWTKEKHMYMSLLQGSDWLYLTTTVDSLGLRSNVTWSYAWSQSCLTHPWSFALKPFSHWIHCQPWDPGAVSKEEAEPARISPIRRMTAFWKCLLLWSSGMGSRAVGAFLIIYVWEILWNRMPVAQEDFVANEKPLDFECCSVLQYQDLRYQVFPLFRCLVL